MAQAALMEDDDVEIYEPDYGIKNKIGRDISVTELLRPDILQQAQSVIQQSKDTFVRLVAEDIARASQMLDGLEATTWDAELLDQFMHVVLQIKARAGTFGYPLATEVARRLYLFCEDDYRAKANHMLVLRKHVEGLGAIMRQNIEGDGGIVGRELLATLNTLVAKLR